MNVKTGPLAMGLVHGAGLVLALWVGNPPASSRSGDAPGRFSEARAWQTLVALMGDGRPRPVGSEANAEARARVVTAFEALGYEARVQSRWVCGPHRHYCAQVHNVVARVETGRGGGAVLLNAHYDSAAATPGAADCLAGVATLVEAARVFTMAPPEGDVIFLVNDGEEAGLLGATAFVDDHPWAGDVRAVVNLEARGSGGPSWPAYTIGADLRLLRHYRTAVDRPAPGSLALALTSFLPLANDLAIFDRLGVPGVTMGFARHPRRYHTPRDDLAHLSRASFAQHGRQAVDLVRALAADPTRASSRGTFASIGPVGAAWPTSWVRALALAALALVLIAAASARDRKALGIRNLVWGLAAAPVLVLFAFFGAACLNAARRAATEIVSANVGMTLPSFLGFSLWGLALVTLVAPWLVRRAGPLGAWLGTWAWWAAFGVVLAWFAPQAAYLTLVPVLAAALAALALRGDDGWRPLARTVVPALAAAAVWYPSLVSIHDLLGIGNLPPVAGLVAIVATTTAALADRGWGRRLAVTLAAAALVLVGFGTRVPTFTDDDPQVGNLVYTLDADTGQAAWTFTGSPLPPGLRAVAEFGDRQRPLEFAPQDAGYRAPAPVVALAPPRFDVTARSAGGGGITIEGRLVSPRGARIGQLVFPADRAPDRVVINDVPVPPDTAPFPLFDAGSRVFTVWTLSPDGIRISLGFPGQDPVRVTLVDRSDGLPGPGGALLAARPTWTAPVGPGDQTIVAVEARWQ